MRIIETLQYGYTYHLYNRGINGTDVFSEERNYAFFLDKWFYYTNPVLYTCAYCLLKNHFHFLITLKGEQVITAKNGKQKILNPSNQIAHCFNSYAQAFNKVYKRHGGLFENPFKRNLIDNERYFGNAIAYIHCNPQKHEFVSDFRDYPHSSYKLHLSDDDVPVNKEGVIKWFGSKKLYIEFHDNYRINSAPENADMM